MKTKPEQPKQECTCHCHHSVRYIGQPDYGNQPNWAECPLMCSLVCAHCCPVNRESEETRPTRLVETSNQLVDAPSSNEWEGIKCKLCNRRHLLKTYCPNSIFRPVDEIEQLILDMLANKKNGSYGVTPIKAFIKDNFISKKEILRIIDNRTTSLGLTDYDGVAEDIISLFNEKEEDK